MRFQYSLIPNTLFRGIKFMRFLWRLRRFMRWNLEERGKEIRLFWRMWWSTRNSFWSMRKRSVCWNRKLKDWWLRWLCWKWRHLRKRSMRFLWRLITSDLKTSTNHNAMWTCQLISKSNPNQTSTTPSNTTPSNREEAKSPRNMAPDRISKSNPHTGLTSTTKTQSSWALQAPSKK